MNLNKKNVLLLVSILAGILAADESDITKIFTKQGERLKSLVGYVPKSRMMRFRGMKELPQLISVNNREYKIETARDEYFRLCEVQGRKMVGSGFVKECATKDEAASKVFRTAAMSSVPLEDIARDWSVASLSGRDEMTWGMGRNAAILSGRIVVFVRSNDKDALYIARIIYELMM